MNAPQRCISHTISYLRICEHFHVRQPSCLWEAGHGAGEADASSKMSSGGLNLANDRSSDACVAL